MRIGSLEHKELFCRSFIDTHNVYEPVDLAWPDLDQQSLARLRTIPFWSIALQTEQNAGLMLTSFASTVSDPLIREAIALQGYEEARHARMIGTLVERYGLDVELEEFSPKPTRGAFIDFGYKECIDSFIAHIPASLLPARKILVVGDGAGLGSVQVVVAWDRRRKRGGLTLDPGRRLAARITASGVDPIVGSQCH